MRPSAEPQKRSAKDRPRPRLLWRLVKWFFVLGLIAAALGAAGIGGIFLWYGRESALPLRNLADYHPKQVTRLISSDNQVIGEIYVERRTVVPYEHIPKLLINAVVAAEDAEFFHHQGLNYLGMLRAFTANLRHGGYKQGGSTITQQVVKTFLLSPERTLKRKVQEVILARRVEATLAKEEILYLYLNQIYYGHGRYGVEEAARFFFGKGVGELSLGEAALIAGLPQSPERLSPLKHPEHAKERQRYVLEQMARRGYIKVGEAERVAREPIRVLRDASPALGVAPEVVDAVREVLVQRYGEAGLAEKGLTVRVTIDSRVQQAARDAVTRGLMTVDGRQGYRGGSGKVHGALDKAIAKLKKDNGPLQKGHVFEGIVTGVDDAKQELVVALGDRDGVVDLAQDERYNPQKKAPAKRFAAGDRVRVRLGEREERPASRKGRKGGGEEPRLALALELGPQAALVALDPHTRQVRAIVGGYDFRPGGFDRALRARRQPGSSFKPLVYAAALAAGKITPATVINDAPDVFGTWKPDNAEQEAYRGPVRVRQAIAHSINTVAVKVINEVGVESVRQLAKLLGIASPINEDPTIALGSAAVTPLELTNAFAAFADEGRVGTPTFIVSIGQEAVAAPPAQPVLAPEVAFLMTSLLRSVVDEGTAGAARKLKWYACGKTGTNYLRKPQPGIRDAWFVGFTPDLVAGVWVGFDDNRKLGRGEQGSRAALPIWIDFMGQALKGKPARGFTPPPGIEIVRIDPRTGLLAAPGSAAYKDEYFVKGTAPTQTAPVEGEATPDSFVIDQQNGAD
ncbi:MAG TPA: PBP1A family penicillin-binding protein [Polyangia bacterium]